MFKQVNILRNAKKISDFKVDICTLFNLQKYNFQGARHSTERTLSLIGFPVTGK